MGGGGGGVISIFVPSKYCRTRVRETKGNAVFVNTLDKENRITNQSDPFNQDKIESVLKEDNHLKTNALKKNVGHLNLNLLFL